VGSYLVRLSYNSRVTLDNPTIPSVFSSIPSSLSSFCILLASKKLHFHQAFSIFHISQLQICALLTSKVDA
jgi:hypothetical protein